jgi:hypothetical protein
MGFVRFISMLHFLSEINARTAPKSGHESLEHSMIKSFSKRISIFVLSALLIHLNEISAAGASSSTRITIARNLIPALPASTERSAFVGQEDGNRTPNFGRGIASNRGLVDEASPSALHFLAAWPTSFAGFGQHHPASDLHSGLRVSGLSARGGGHWSADPGDRSRHVAADR